LVALAGAAQDGPALVLQAALVLRDTAFLARDPCVLVPLFVAETLPPIRLDSALATTIIVIIYAQQTCE
jgi:hypothetical protein